MATTTPNFGLNIVEGSDYVNPLIYDNQNYNKIDTAMQKNKQNSVQTAAMAYNLGTIAITRDSSEPSTFKFVSTVNYKSTDQFTVDSIAVTGVLPDGSALPENAFRINSTVLCTLNGTVLTVYTNAASNALIAYPVGSIYMSVNSESPATLFGGTWQRLQNTFLLAAGSNYPAGSTGGEAMHTLTKNELPNYTLPNVELIGSITNSDSRVFCENTACSGIITETAKHGPYKVARESKNGNALGDIKIDASHSHTSGGNDSPHNNMPPYLAVYMWQRTA